MLNVLEIDDDLMVITKQYVCHFFEVTLSLPLLFLQNVLKITLTLFDKVIVLFSNKQLINSW